jgi:diguanylate cyclase (GGDEF)-like protein
MMQAPCGPGLAMWFDLDTLFFTTVFTSAVAGLLLLLTWLQNRNVIALALWGSGFVLGAAGMALVVLRGAIPDLWSIVVGNALLAIGYGLGWTGAREFAGRSRIIPAALAGAAVWIAACAVHPIYTSPHARTAVMVVIVVSYLILTAWEFYRSRETNLMSRWPIITVLVLHATVYASRIPLAGTWPLLGEDKAPLGWRVAVALEVILGGFCLAYLLGSMARERIVLGFQRDALADPLTGVPNRRAFFEQGEKLLRRVQHGRRPVAVLALDLDNFKAINDRFGHQAGDLVLRAFCDSAVATLRPGDLFGRLGGEEFACLLPNAPRSGATQAAERIRSRFADAQIAIGEVSLSATVSVGVAVSEGYGQDLTELVAAADKALYSAKRNGRNRVELAPPRLVVVEPSRTKKEAG